MALRILKFFLIVYLFHPFKSIGKNFSYHILKDSTVGIVKNSIVFKVDSTLLPLTFYYTDSLGKGNMVFFNHINNRIPIHYPTFLIHATEEQTPFFIHPGDSILIYKNNFKHLVMRSAKDSTWDNELQIFRMLVEKTYPLHYALFPVKKSYLARVAASASMIANDEKTIQQIKAQRIRLANEFMQHHRVSEFLKWYVFISIATDAIDDHLLLYWKNRARLIAEGSLANKIQNQINLLKQIPFNINVMYLHTLYNAVSISNTKYRDHFPINSIEFNQYNQFVQQFNDTIKNFLTTSYLKAAIKVNLTLPLNFIEDYQQRCIDSTYKKIITEALLQKKLGLDFKKTDTLINYQSNQPIELQDLITQNKSKLILLDFWASWCAPCRYEMPFSKTLQKKFEGKNIVFIYLSVDENKLDWKRAVEEENMNGKNSFLFLNGFSAPFLVKNTISTIPRYILINKNGTVISENAPRPSTKDLMMMIQKNLNE